MIQKPEPTRTRSTWKQATWTFFVLMLTVQGVSAQGVSDEIQRRREEMERKKAEFLRERARVQDINTRVQRYRALRDSIPFISIPGTTNIVRVYVNNHDIEQIARDLYFLTDGASERAFQRDYWSTVLWLNQADQYRHGLPEYAPLDAEDPDANLAIFPNIRKRGMTAVVAQLTSEDSALARQFTTHAVFAYRTRLKAEALALAAEAGEPPDVSGPERLSGEPRFALFRLVVDEVRDTLPARKLPETSIFYGLERDPVAINETASLEPAPPALALRQGVNMLGADYQGYDVNYTPDPEGVMFSPEGGPMAFFGGRTPDGESRTQFGVYFSFNQKFLKFLALNQTAFAAFSANEAPSVNGGALNGGVDFDFGYFNVAGLVGVSAFNVVSETTTGLAITGKLGIPIGPRVQLGAIVMSSNASVRRGASFLGINNAGFAGINLSIR